jgi:SCP-2 sterol transfer family protein
MNDQHDGVDAEELHQAIREYRDRVNASPRARKTLAAWSCRIHIEATDVADACFTLQVDTGEATDVVSGLEGTPDLVVRGHSFDLAEIFWGDANPVSNYMQGAIKTQGRAEDVMRLDAMAMFVFLKQ